MTHPSITHPNYLGYGLVELKSNHPTRPDYVVIDLGEVQAIQVSSANPGMWLRFKGKEDAVFFEGTDYDALKRVWLDHLLVVATEREEQAEKRLMKR